jgi:hypothetical protein
MDFEKNQLLRIDTLVRKGFFKEAKGLLRSLVRHPLERKYRVQAASLARRLSLPELGVKLLAPYVRPKARAPVEAKEPEIIEYAASLIRMRVLSESEGLLSSIDAERFPSANLFRAFIAISQWDFLKAEPLLKSYSMNPEVSPYESLIAKTNIAMGLVFEERIEEADLLLNAIIEESKASKSQLLLASALRFKTENEINRENLDGAIKSIEEAQRSLTDKGVIDTLLIDRQRAELQIKLTGPSKSNLTEMNIIRGRAMKLGR